MFYICSLPVVEHLFLIGKSIVGIWLLQICFQRERIISNYHVWDRVVNTIYLSRIPWTKLNRLKARFCHVILPGGRAFSLWMATEHLQCTCSRFLLLAIILLSEKNRDSLGNIKTMCLKIFTKSGL